MYNGADVVRHGGMRAVGACAGLTMVRRRRQGGVRVARIEDSGQAQGPVFRGGEERRILYHSPASCTREVFRKYIIIISFSCARAARSRRVARPRCVPVCVSSEPQPEAAPAHTRDPTAAPAPRGRGAPRPPRARRALFARGGVAVGFPFGASDRTVLGALCAGVAQGQQRAVEPGRQCGPSAALPAHRS